MSDPSKQLFCLLNSSKTFTSNLLKPICTRVLCLNHDQLDEIEVFDQPTSSFLRTEGIFYVPQRRADSEYLYNNGGAITSEVSALVSKIKDFPGKSFSIIALGTEKSPRGDFIYSGCLQNIMSLASKPNCWYNKIECRFNLLARNHPAIELCQTKLVDPDK